MALIGRIFVILFACLLASFAAGLVVTLAVVLPDLSDLALGPFEQGAFGLMIGFGALFVSFYAFVPVLLVIVAAEAFSIRSLLFYAAAGALLGCVLYLNFGGWNWGAVTVQGFARREIEIMAAAGIVAGFVYWVIAGRNAGKWREPRQNLDRARTRLQRPSTVHRRCAVAQGRNSATAVDEPGLQRTVISAALRPRKPSLNSPLKTAAAPRRRPSVPRTSSRSPASRAANGGSRR